MTHTEQNTAADEHAARSQSWSRYWSSGVLHSCPGSFRGNYDGAIAEFWKDAFAALTSAQRVLDVASGNGALPRLLFGLDGGNDCGCRVDAIDLATLAPTWLGELNDAQRSRLHLHSGVLAERLPFSDATFDLVVSQYGIEYADLTAALAEAARVLRPQGGLRLLIHHREALPVRKGAVEARLLDGLLAAGGLIDAAHCMLPWLALAANDWGRAQLQGNAAANADRAAFNTVQQRIAADIAKAGNDADILHEARDQIQKLFAIAQAQGIEHANAACAQLRLAYAEHQLRAHELVTHALDVDRMKALMRELDGLGFTIVTAQPLSYQSHLMGWALRADRA